MATAGAPIPQIAVHSGIQVRPLHALYHLSQKIVDLQRRRTRIVQRKTDTRLGVERVGVIAQKGDLLGADIINTPLVKRGRINYALFRLNRLTVTAFAVAGLSNVRGVGIVIVVPRMNSLGIAGRSMIGKPDHVIVHT